MGVTILTPTGDRHAALRNLARYIRRQTYTGDVQWVVVDDGETPYRPHEYLARPVDCASFELTYLRRDEPGVRGGSLNRNLIRGLQLAKHEHVVVMEDDDWYRDTYLEVMSGKLGDVELFGEAGSVYYNVRERRWTKLGNGSHASLCQTAFRRSIVDKIDASCRVRSPFVDLAIWKISGVKKRLQPFFGMCVGIKGMPGRTGYGVGHRDSFGEHSDGRMVKLRELIGGDVSLYAEYAKLQIPSWWEWAANKPRGRCLILGKGPTFDLGRNAQCDLVIGLNHACRERRVDVAHAIDIDVVRDLGPALLDACGVLVMPWHPHEKFKHSTKTLVEYVRESDVLARLASERRLLCYHASIHEKYRTRPSDEPAATVRAFSVEAVVDLLTQSGWREIFTAGIDGGARYSDTFDDLVPLSNSQASFDSQWPGVRRSSRLRQARVIPLVESRVPDPPVAFVHVPKCAGTSIWRTVSEHISSMHIYEQRDESPRFVYGHASADEMLSRFPGCKLVTCVRHPVDRLVSLYRFWRMQARHYTEQGLPFTDARHAEFILQEWSIERLAESMTSTLRDFVGDPSRFELVTTNERLREDWPKLLEIVGLPRDTPLSRRNPTPRAEATPEFDRDLVENVLRDEITFYAGLIPKM